MINIGIVLNSVVQIGLLKEKFPVIEISFPHNLYQRTPKSNLKGILKRRDSFLPNPSKLPSAK